MKKLTTCLVMAALIAGCGQSRDWQSRNNRDMTPQNVSRVERVDVNAARPSTADNTAIARIARNYLRFGQGRIVIFLPQSNSVAASGGWVKQELIAQGIGQNRIQMDMRPLPAGIVRVAFATQNRQSAARRSTASEDIQQRAEETSWLNQELENYGCAFESNLYAQADAPSDFVRSRLDGKIDPVRAALSVRKLRAATGSAQAPTVSTGTGQ